MTKKELKKVLEEDYAWGNLDAKESKWLIDELLDDFLDILEKQLTLTDVGCSFCEEIPKDSFYLGTTCEKCNKPFRVVKNKQ